MAPGIPGFAKEVSMNSWLTWGYWYMFLLLKELLQPDGLPAPTHPLGRGVFNETPSPSLNIWKYALNYEDPLDIIYLDFAKAFDKIPHKWLVQNLEAHGIAGDSYKHLGTNWLASISNFRWLWEKTLWSI